MAAASLQQGQFHRKIKQWPHDHQLFTKLVREAIANGTPLNILYTELDPVEPEVDKPYLWPENINKGDGPWAHGETFLHRALRLKLYELAEFLLNSGAEVNKRNELGRTPLHEAVLDRDRQAVALLSKYDADVESLTTTIDVVWYKGGEAVTGEGGLTPMHLAIYNSDVEMLRHLVSFDADLHHEVDGSWSYLDLALLQEDPRTTDFFLSNGLKLRKEPFGFTHPKESKAAAQALKAYVTSRHLIPPNELLNSYKEALSRLHFCKWGIDVEDEEDPPSTELIVSTFSEHLETLAGLGSDYRQFCDDCWQLDEELRLFYQDNTIRDFLEYRLKPSRQALFETANRAEWPCALCAYITDSLDFTEARIQDKGKVAAEWKVPEGPVDVCFSMVDCLFASNDTVKSFQGACGSSGFCPEMRTYPDGIAFHYNFNWINALNLPSSHEQDDRKLGTASQRAFAMAENWRADCEKHKACGEMSRRGASGTYRPKLLHVGNDDCALHLEEDVGVDAVYAALLYCSDESSAQWWTTSGNLEQRKVSVDPDSLPIICKEAVLVARRLGFGYIWIEGICLVQDSADARSEKTAHFHTVYENAALTISKVNGTGASQSLFSRRLSRSLHPVPLNIWQPKCRRPSYSEGAIHSFALVRSEYARSPTLDGSNVHTAWSLQAELFSSRALHFGNGMLHWECLCEYKNEALSARSDYAKKIIDQRLKSRLVFRRVPSEHATSIIECADDLSPMENWQSLLETYSDRDLSKASDRLPAFWAIGKHMEGIMEDEFSCGMWKGKHFLQSLCWAAMVPSTAKTALPTWTWVSNQQRLTFASLDTTGRQREVLPLTDLVSWNGTMCPDSYAVSGTLTLKGPLYPLEKRSKDWTWGAKFLDFERPVTPCEGTDEDIYSSVFDGIDVTGCYVLDILAFRGATGEEVTGDGWQWPAGRAAAKVALLLEKVDEKAAVFRRSGVLIIDFVRGNLNPTTFRDETLVQTITLI